MLQAAKTHLAQDPILQPLVEQNELQPIHVSGDLYEYLVKSIVFQQLSGKAASTIHNRFLNLFPAKYPDPNELINFEIEELRAVGLSRAKSNYVQNIAHFFIEQQLFEAEWEKYEDKALIDLFTQIKGVGKWTVQMVLMFYLERSDVFPVDDLVVHNSIVELYEVNEPNTRKRKAILHEIAEPWRPYRSYASRYLWRWRDTLTV